MPMHEHFEELCALAAIGQLTDQELHQLSEHLAHCEPCRHESDDFAFILGQLPAAVSPTISGDATELLSESYRRKFLLRASAEGIGFTKEARDRAPSLSFRSGLYRYRHLAIAIAAISIFSLALPFAGVFRGHFKEENNVNRRSEFGKVAVQSQLAPVKSESAASAVDPAAVRDLKRQISLLQHREAELLDERRRIQAESTALHQQLNVVTTRAETLTSKLEKSGQALSETNSELDNLRNAEAELLGDLNTNHIKLQELTRKAAEDENALNRERQLNAIAKDIRRLMAARNVHIVDVYDYDTRGKRDKSFGRVVYIEGESLIFYAFDLGKTDSGSKVSFQAWGQREGTETQARNLGVFNIDDHEQKRWVLRVEDPELLSSIDSVFVTVEPSPGRKNPSGKRLLYAYLGTSPNHP
jgi:hypothetical protein